MPKALHFSLVGSHRRPQTPGAPLAALSASTRISLSLLLGTSLALAAPKAAEAPGTTPAAVPAPAPKSQLRPSTAKKASIRPADDAEQGRLRSGTRARVTKEAEPKYHVVQDGQRLGSIAKRYQIKVEDLLTANGLKRTAVIRPGLRLLIPVRGMADPCTQVFTSLGNPRGALRLSGSSQRPKGFLEIVTHTEHWGGIVLDHKGRLCPQAAEKISDLLGAKGDRPDTDPRLIRLMLTVSDHFDGRALRVISGYRTSSFFRNSRHKHSRAVDFSVYGVANDVLRDYLRKQTNVGVGFYPNSTFIHMDVRENQAYWVDYAGHGEAPRRTPEPAWLHHFAPKHTKDAEPKEPEVVEPEGTTLPLDPPPPLQQLEEDDKPEGAGADDDE